MKTNEGRDIYPSDSCIRQAIPKESLCKHCRHLGDLCTPLKREFVDTGPARVVTRCEGCE